MNSSALYLSLVATLVAPVLFGAEPPPEKVVVQPSAWRPYKDAKEILFYDSFERTLPYVKEGKITTEEPVPPGGHALKMDAHDDHSITAKFDLTATQLKIPSGFNPSQTFVQFNVYCEDAGEIKIKFLFKGGDIEHSQPVPKAKTWGLVTLKIADARNKAVRAETDQLFTAMEIIITPPKTRKTAPKGYVDGLVFTYGANPNDVRPHLMAVEKKRTDMERNIEKDGFVFSMPIHDFLARQIKPLKSRVKAKSVLVAGPTPELTQAWVKQLAAAAQQVKETSYVFTAAVEPGSEEKPIGGLADARLLLSYNLQKETEQKGPELLLLIVGAEDAVGAGRPSESVHVILERALATGTVPVVVLPAPATADEKDKVAEFTRVTGGYAQQWGIPMLEAASVSKNDKGAFDPALTGPKTFDKLVLKAMTALKHVHDNMAKE